MSLADCDLGLALQALPVRPRAIAGDGIRVEVWEVIIGFGFWFSNTVLVYSIHLYKEEINGS